MFKGRFNFSVDLGIPVAGFSTVFAAVLSCRCLYMFVLMRDVVCTVMVFSTMCDVGNVTFGTEEWTSLPEHALKVAIGLVTVSCPVLSMTGLVCVCPVGSVRVVLYARNLDVDGDLDADGDKMAMVEFVAVFGTFAFVSTFFGDVRVVMGVTNLDVD